MDDDEKELHEKRKQLMQGQSEPKDELIDKLIKGDMFGEIGLLTQLRRTCTVITGDSSLLMCMYTDGIKKIKNQFPSIFNSIQSNMDRYFDRDTCKRIRFVQNIPYFRKMDQAILYKISYLLIEDRNISLGDLILQ